MRTIKRGSIELNKGKQETLLSIAASYAQEKQYWLNRFQQKNNTAYIKDHRTIRDQAIATGYRSPYHLQARMWKLALQDAADTMDKYWQSLFEKIKSDIGRSRLSKEQKHYAFWLLKSYQRLSEISFCRYPTFNQLQFQDRKQVVLFIHKKISKYRKNYPKVKMAKSFMLDANCYDVFTHHSRQYISIMTLTPRKRLVLPLAGHTVISGNIKVVINKPRAVEIHHTAKVKQLSNEPNNDHIIGIDFGYSEVMTDDEGKQYSPAFGETMSTHSDWLNKKMKRRHKLHALQKKYAASKNPEHKRKSKNIRKFNLGRKKLDAKQQAIKATLNRDINKAYNDLTKKQPRIVVSETLSHHFDYNKGKNWNRKLSAWVRGILQERLQFKALAKGFSHKQVNPAYSSQTCPLSWCGYVDSKNRKGDKFQCQRCGHVGHADWIAALNLKSRYGDEDITRYTPYRQVKEILLARFHRHLETNLGTVRGRIPDTCLNVSTI